MQTTEVKPPSEAGWIDYPPPARIETPLGGLKVHALARDVVRVEAGIPHNADDAEGFAVNGVSYSVQSFVYRHADGAWRCGAEDSREAYREPRLSRREYRADRSYADNEPTLAATKKARAVIGEAVSKWAADHAAELERGDYVKRAHDAYTLAKQIDEHEQGLATLRENLAACDAGLAYSAYPLSD